MANKNHDKDTVLLMAFQSALYRCFDEHIELDKMESKLVRYVTKKLKKYSWFESVHLKYHADPSHPMPNRFDIGVKTHSGDPLFLQFEVKILESMPDTSNKTLH